MTFVLILAVMGYGAVTGPLPSVTAATFSDEKACQDALADFAKAMKHRHLVVDGDCYPAESGGAR